MIFCCLCIVHTYEDISQILHTDCSVVYLGPGVVGEEGVDLVVGVHVSRLAKQSQKNLC